MSSDRRITSFEELTASQFNVLCLNPNDLSSFPEGLLDTLHENATPPLQVGPSKDQSIEDRLRQQMQADRLQAINSEDEDALPSGKAIHAYSMDTIQEASQLLRLNVRIHLYGFLSFHAHLFVIHAGSGSSAAYA